MIAAFFTAQAALFAVLLLVVLRAQAKRERAHARREDLLLNQMLNLAGKPWQQAPADQRERTPVEPDPFVLDGEQLLP